MKISTERDIAVFDLDGVIVKNPKEALTKTIIDGAYWDNHWLHPDKAELNDEIVDLIQSLISTNWQIIILTARPSKYRGPTISVLARAGIYPLPLPIDELKQHYNSPILVMIPNSDIPHSSAAWKQHTIKSWKDQGANIRFMMEDYRPNAEAVRAVVPVLLYEYKRPSKVLAFACSGCGGVAACWCNNSETPSA